MTDRINDPTQKIILFIPPAYERDIPPLGTPALVGFLKAKGLPAQQRDLNLLYFDYIKNRLESLFSEEYRDEKIKKKVYYHSVLRYQKSKGGVAYWFEHNPGSSFAFTEKILSSPVLFRYLADMGENPFARFFIQKVLPLIQRGSYPIVGFSITAPSQVIATFTFCYLLKRELPAVKIIIGGQWVSFYREALRKRQDFHRLFDFMICFEGETPLLSLLKALTLDQPLLSVPNLIYHDNGKWKESKVRSDEHMDQLPAPDFSGLPIKKYLNSKDELNLTIETSRGCYWNKCIFCIDLPLPKPKYREKSPNLVIRDIKTLVRKYGVKHLFVSNATFSPWQMREVSKQILIEKINVSWWTMARLDDDLDREIMKLAKAAGCSMIGFGMESINQRVLDFIKKGTRRETIEKIVKDAHELNLSVYFQTMFGIPSERVEEALETIEFLTAFQGPLDGSPAFNTYYLIPKNEVFLNPEKYGIEIMPHERLPFRYFYPFQHKTGNINVTMSAKLIGLYAGLIEKRRLSAISSDRSVV
jgi:radical SAM superfamily enzyme YgiQ (UPF0313 family)